ncbi:hypothetical protein WJX74_002498 [Apatococcus lobatus]|uniref:Uncharacterized protein n=1 Tax=Apatococcus lobatus TaxID=904363 RepID=A0AAW1RBI3_9CHLO
MSKRAQPNWEEEASSSLEQLRLRQDSTPPTTSDPKGIVHTFRLEIQKFWRSHASGFTAYWTGLSQADKVNLVLTVAPYTPDKRGDRSVVRDGIREDVTGSSILLPDLNVQDLIKDGPSGLIALFAQMGCMQGQVAVPSAAASQ